MLNYIAAALGGLATASATRKAAKDQAAALAEQRAVTEQYANQAMEAQQQAARRAATAQVTGARNTYSALETGANRAADAGVSGYRSANKELSRYGDRAINVIQDGLGQMWDRYQPAVDLGNWGVGQIKDHLSGKSGYTGSAAYKFLQREMSDALQAAQAKKGQLFSGATGDALIQRTRELGALDEQQYFNNLYNTTAMGQGALNTATGYDMAGRGNIAGINMNVGSGRAANQAAIGGVNAQRYANIGNAAADMHSTIGSAGAQRALNIGNASANAANVIGGVAGTTAAQMGDVAAAERIGVANAFTGAMDNVLGAYQYNQMANQFPNYYGTQTNTTGAPASSPAPWTNPFYQGA